MLYIQFLRSWKKSVTRLSEPVRLVNNRILRCAGSLTMNSRTGAKLAENEVSLPATIHGLTVSEVVNALSECGYECSVMGDLIGGSGESHRFDFLGRKDGERLVIMGFEIIAMRADELEMVKLRAKTLDSNPTTTVVVFQSKNTGKLRLIEGF